MNIPQYVSIEEVQRVCKQLGIRDWTALSEGEASSEEARAILDTVNVQGMPIDQEEFRRGLTVELEHGLMFKDANVTNNHPVLTGMVVLAHMKESLDYYKYLEVAELKGDLLKAAVAGDAAKLMAKYRKLTTASRGLAEAECKQLDKG